MAQEQAEAVAGRRTLILNFRVDEVLWRELQAFADAGGVSRSEAARVLLSGALGNPAQRVAAQETVLLCGAIRRKFLARLLEAVQASIPEALARAESETAETSS